MSLTSEYYADDNTVPANSNTVPANKNIPIVLVGNNTVSDNTQLKPDDVVANLKANANIGISTLSFKLEEILKTLNTENLREANSYLIKISKSWDFDTIKDYISKIEEIAKKSKQEKENVTSSATGAKETVLNTKRIEENPEEFIKSFLTANKTFIDW